MWKKFGVLNNVIIFVETIKNKDKMKTQKTDVILALTSFIFIIGLIVSLAII